MLLPLTTASQIVFAINEGQFADDVLYKATTSSGSIELKNNSIRFTSLLPKAFEDLSAIGPKDTVGWCWEMHFLDTRSPQIAHARSSITKTRFHYYLGNNSENWKTDVQGVDRVVYKDLYHGIDLVVYSNKKGLKYDFVVHPGANPEDIHWSYRGASAVEINEGDLLISSSLGQVRDSAPVAHQDSDEIAVCFDLRDGVVSLRTGDFDKSKDLVIDPEVEWITHVGGPFGGLCGYLYPDGRIVTGGVGTYWGGYEIPDTGEGVVLGASLYGACSVAAFEADGASVLWIAVLGGDSTLANLANSFENVTVDTLTNTIFAIGGLTAPGFPTTSGSYMETYSSESPPGIVCALSADGSELIASSYVPYEISGGMLTSSFSTSLQWDQIQYRRGFETDGQSLYFSWNFISGMDDYSFTQNTGTNGSHGCVLCSMDLSLSQLNWSTAFSPPGPSWAPMGMNDLICLSNADIAVCGNARVGSLPITDGAFDATFEGQEEAYIAIFEAATGNLKHMTYFGGTGKDQAWLLHETASGLAVFGKTNSEQNYPPAQLDIGNGRLWVAEFDVSLSNLLSHHRIGWEEEPIVGIDDLIPTGFEVDDCGFYYLYANQYDLCSMGCLGIVGLPTSANSMQETGNTYLVVLNTLSDVIQYSTLLNGDNPAGSEYILFGLTESNHIAVLARAGELDNTSGFTAQTATEGAFASSWPTPDYTNGSYILNYDFSDMPSGWVQADLESLVAQATCAQTEVLFGSNTLGDTYQWQTSAGTQTTQIPEFSISFPSGTSQTVHLIITDTSTCNVTDTASINISLPPVFSALENTFSYQMSDSCLLPQEVVFEFTGSEATHVEWLMDGQTVSEDEDFTLEVNEEGIYLVNLVATDAVCDSVSMESVELHFYEPLSTEFSSELVLSETCGPSWLEAELSGTGISSINWYVNGVWASNNLSFSDQVLNSGDYHLSYTVHNDDCETSDSASHVFEIPEKLPFIPFDVPTIFSPQFDGVNDTFRLIPKEGFEEMVVLAFRVYNRWGSLIHETLNAPVEWNGATSNEIVTEGVYYYELVYSLPCIHEHQFAQGTLHVVK